jgi:hypothetical protein
MRYLLPGLGGFELAEHADHQATRPSEQARQRYPQLPRLGARLAPAQQMVQLAGQGRGHRPFKFAADIPQQPLNPGSRLRRQAPQLTFFGHRIEQEPHPQHAIGRLDPVHLTCTGSPGQFHHDMRLWRGTHARRPLNAGHLTRLPSGPVCAPGGALVLRRPLPVSRHLNRKRSPPGRIGRHRHPLVPGGDASQR